MQLENLSPTGDRAAPVSGQGHMSLDPSAPSPGPPARRMGGCLPVNDRRALHDALRCVPELVRSADGHQGPEPPAGPHGAGPRDARPRCSCVCVLTRRPGRHKTEGFGPGDCCQDLPCLSAISTFPARVDRSRGRRWKSPVGRGSPQAGVGLRGPGRAGAGRAC